MIEKHCHECSKPCDASRTGLLTGCLIEEPGDREEFAAIMARVNADAKREEEDRRRRFEHRWVV